MGRRIGSALIACAIFVMAATLLVMARTGNHRPRAAPVVAADRGAYALVVSWTLPAEAGGTGLGLCPADRPVARWVGEPVYDRRGLLLVDACCGLASSSHCDRRLVEIDPETGAIQDREYQWPDAARLVAYDPVGDELVFAGDRTISAAPLPAGRGDVRAWAVMRAPDRVDNAPRDVAVGPDGTVFTFSPAGIGRYGPASDRFAPWAVRVGGSSAQPGSLHVDAAASVYVHDPSLGGGIARFSDRGEPDADWRHQGSATASGPLAAFPGSATLHLLVGDGGSEALAIRRIGPDGRAVATLALGDGLAADPRPTLAVAPDGGFALKGRTAAGRESLLLYGADGSLRWVVGLQPLNAPLGVQGAHVSAAPDGRVLVLGRSAVMQFDADGTKRSIWAAPPGAVDAAIGSGGAVFVREPAADPGASVIRRYDESGTLRWSAEVDAPATGGIAASSELVFAALPSRAAVTLRDTRSGKRVARLSTVMSDEAFLPTDLALAADDVMAALDVDREEVQVWDARRSLLGPVHRILVGDVRDFVRPIALAAGPGGRIAVLEIVSPSREEAVPRIRVLDAVGTALWTLDASDAPVSSWLEDVAFDGEGRLIVLAGDRRLPGEPAEPSRYGAGRVLVFAPRTGFPTPPPAASPSPLPPPEAANGGPCAVDGDKQARPGEVWLGDEVTVTIRLAQSCPEATGPADIVLVIDKSGSMQGSGEVAAGRAVQAFLDEVELDRHRVGVVTFGSVAGLVQALTDDPGALAALPDRFGSTGKTNMAAGLHVAARHLRADGRSGAKWVIVFFTDGGWNEGGDPVPLAVEARREGIHIYAVGSGAAAYDQTLLRLAGSPERTFWAPELEDLPEMYRRIARLIGADPGPVAIVDVLGRDVELVPGTASDPPVSLPGSTLRWAWPSFADAPPTLTYRVLPLRAGWLPTNDAAWFDYVDADQVVRRFRYPVPHVRVRARATATPTATATPSPSPTPTPTRPAYLPLVLSEPICKPGTWRMDAALVLDASTSMNETTSGDRRKLDAARDAAAAFVDRIALGRGDRVAVIAFHHEARLLQALTDRRSDIDRALAAIDTAPQTCLVCGVAAAYEELSGASRRPASRSVMIVLTDGLSNPRPASEAVALAGRAKADGVLIFTIGLGPEVDAAALAAMASAPSHYHRTVDAEALAEIYQTIAGAIPCPADAFWPYR